MKSVWRLALIMLAVFLVAAVVTFNMEGAAVGQTKPLSDVDAFKHLNLTTLEGEPFTADMLRAYDIVVVDMWYTECFHCVDGMPQAARFAASMDTLFPNNKVLYIGICTDIIDMDGTLHEDMLASAKSISRNANVQYPQLIADAPFLKDFVKPYISGFPTILYLDGEGNILHTTGGLTENGYMLQINQLLSAKGE